MLWLLYSSGSSSIICGYFLLWRESDGCPGSLSLPCILSLWLILVPKRSTAQVIDCSNCSSTSHFISLMFPRAPVNQESEKRIPNLSELCVCCPSEVIFSSRSQEYTKTERAWSCLRGARAHPEFPGIFCIPSCLKLG